MYAPQLPSLFLGFDGGPYTIDEAKEKKRHYQTDIDNIEVEIAKLEARKNEQGLSPENVRSLRQELERFMERNIKEASFQEKLELLAIAGIVVYPSEDLKSRKIKCQLDLAKVKKEGQQAGFAKVTFGGPYGTLPELFFEKKQFIPALQQLVLSYLKLKG